MQDNNQFDNQFEQYPGSRKAESDVRLEAINFDKGISGETGSPVPPFAGEDATFPTAEYSSAPEPTPTPDLTPTPSEEDPTNNGLNEGLADASAILNYGLDAAARKYGVEKVIQGIKTFDATGSSAPIRDLYIHLGIDTKEETEEMHDENVANQPAKAELQENIGANANANRSNEGALQAIADMKELISEVEGADPRYESLRQGAKAAGKGVFEYAVESFGTQGLVELFMTLKEQREQKDHEQSNPEDSVEANPEEGVSEDPDNPNTLDGSDTESTEPIGFNAPNQDPTMLTIPHDQRETLNPEIIAPKPPNFYEEPEEVKTAAAPAALPPSPPDGPDDNTPFNSDMPFIPNTPSNPDFSNKREEIDFEKYSEKIYDPSKDNRLNTNVDDPSANKIS